MIAIAIATTTYQHTSLTHWTLTSIIFAVLSAGIYLFLLINILRPKVFHYFQAKLGGNSYLFPSVLVLLALVGGICGLQSLNTLNDMEKNLMANIKQVYDVDSIQIEVDKPEGTHLWFDSNYYAPNQEVRAIATKGSQTYRVSVQQNPDTYEPTLASQDNTGIAELRHNR